MFRNLVKWSVILGAIAIAAIVIAPFVLPSQTVKRELVNLIESNTGWRIELNGDVSMSIFPSLALQADDIEVSPPNSDPLISADEARFSLAAAQLISGTIAIEEISLDAPIINLALDEDGKPLFLASIDNEQSQITTTQDEEPEAAGGLFATLFNTLSVAKLGISDARIEVGKQGENPTTAENVNLNASLTDSQGPLIMTGSASINGEVIDLNGRIPSFKTFLNESKGTIETSLTYRDAIASTNGLLDLNADTLYSGDVKLNVEDIQKTAGTDSIIDGKAVASGTITATDGEFSLKLDEGRIVETLFFINLSLNTKTPRPLLSGTIDLGAIDIQKLFPKQSNSQSSSVIDSSSSTQTVGYDLSAL